MAASEALRDVVHRLGTNESLDRVGKPLAAAVGNFLGKNRALKDVLSGTWLTHPLHPMLTDLPIGSWTSAMVLDLVGGRRSRAAADSLVGLGVLTALPTAAAGLSDWADTIGEERRIGSAHAIANAAALSLYSLSWLARRRGRRRLGVTLGLLGGTAATAGGYLGAHLVYRKGVGADRNAWKHGGDEWTEVADDALAAGQPLVVTVGDDEVLLVRTGTGTGTGAGAAAQVSAQVSAISNVCGHAGGPLHEGSFDEPGCVTCPWHASVFRLVDGHVVHGPATGHQPRYDVRSEGGRLSVRRGRTSA